MEPALTAMNAASHLVVVKAPLDRVYEQWSHLEDLPKFVTQLQDVRRIDDTHFSYRWQPNGADKKGGLPHGPADSRASNRVAQHL